MMCLDDLYNEMIACDRFELYEYYKILCNAYLYKLKRLWDLSDESLRWVNDNIGIELQYGWDYYIPMRMMSTRHGAKILFMSIAICRTENTPTFHRFGMMRRKSQKKAN